MNVIAKFPPFTGRISAAGQGKAEGPQGPLRRLRVRNVSDAALQVRLGPGAATAYNHHKRWWLPSRYTSAFILRRPRSLQERLTWVQITQLTFLCKPSFSLHRHGPWETREAQLRALKMCRFQVATWHCHFSLYGGNMTSIIKNAFWGLAAGTKWLWSCCLVWFGQLGQLHNNKMF